MTSSRIQLKVFFDFFALLVMVELAYAQQMIVFSASDGKTNLILLDSKSGRSKKILTFDERLEIGQVTASPTGAFLVAVVSDWRELSFPEDWRVLLVDLKAKRAFTIKLDKDSEIPAPVWLDPNHFYLTADKGDAFFIYTFGQNGQRTKVEKINKPQEYYFLSSGV